MTDSTPPLPTRSLSWHHLREQKADLVSHEWLVTNGLGGYASGTVCGVPTRGYHGLLIAALPAPLGRYVLLGALAEEVALADGRTVRLDGDDLTHDDDEPDAARHLLSFALEGGLPVWRHRFDGVTIEKRVWMPDQLNTALTRFTLAEGEGAVRLVLRPTAIFRRLGDSVDTPLPGPMRLQTRDGRVELSCDCGAPPVSLAFLEADAKLPEAGQPRHGVRYRTERRRGYAWSGPVYEAGAFEAELRPGRPMTFVATCESWDALRANLPEESLRAEQDRRRRLIQAAAPELRGGLGAELALAADQFLIVPATRRAERSQRRAAGDEAHTVIAGYHWFTDWGRDTMISLDGLTLATGRHGEAGAILRTFAEHMRDGLIPNYFPDGQTEGVYHTADATLWFFHALGRYVDSTGDRDTLRRLLPKLRAVIDHHVRGTRFGIGVDANDGLLRQGADGYQLTWMDAKVGDWVVTPRRGKAVEINALWYNALCLLRGWLGEEGDARAAAAELTPLIDRARASFNARFWSDELGHLYDVIDGEHGDDPACRPNQLFAIALPHAVLDERRWPAVLQVAEAKLLTPVGLRSLSPGHPDYKPRYDGDLRARDAAYHQGTVWAWLIGPYVDAYLKVHPERAAEARRLLDGFAAHLSEAGVGSISEVFDAEPPYTPRGCIAQAWSVAEVARLSRRLGG